MLMTTFDEGAGRKRAYRYNRDKAQVTVFYGGESGNRTRDLGVMSAGRSDYIGLSDAQKGRKQACFDHTGAENRHTNFELAFKFATLVSYATLAYNAQQLHTVSTVATTETEMKSGQMKLIESMEIEIKETHEKMVAAQIKGHMGTAAMLSHAKASLIADLEKVLND